ncbi:MAG TPA: PsiF family protein [Burkholderiales bacterium]|nr:PsiF family protein [Burkholderiales bacterium]
MKLDLASVFMAALAALFLALHGVRAFAAEDLKPHQRQMKACNTQADRKGLTAGERNHFMRSCLKGHNGNGHKLTAHQKRSQECTSRAREKGLEGAERRGFMSECEKPPAEQKVAEKAKMKGCQRRAAERKLDAEERRKYIYGCMNGAASARAASGS